MKRTLFKLVWVLPILLIGFGVSSQPFSDPVEGGYCPGGVCGGDLDVGTNTLKTDSINSSTSPAAGIGLGDDIDLDTNKLFMDYSLVTNRYFGMVSSNPGIVSQNKECSLAGWWICTGAIRAGTSENFGWGGTKGKIYSPADSQVSIQNNAATSGATIDVSSDGFFKIMDRAGTGRGNLTVNGKIATVVDSDTIADSGDGNPATATLTPTASYVKLTCNDAHTCDITMGEAVLDGTQVEIFNVSANACDFSDTSGVSELAGAFAMGQYDSLKLVYVADRWIEVSRSDN